MQQVPLAVTAGILIVAASSALQPRAALDVWRADRTSAAIMLVDLRPRPRRPAAVRGARRGGDLRAQVHLPVVARRARHAGRDRRRRASEGDGGAARRSRATTVTVLDIYGSLFFAAAPKIRASLPAVGEAHCPVVVLRLRGRGTLHSATIALIRDYAAECAACGGRLYLAGVGRRDAGAAAAHRPAGPARSRRGGGGHGRALRRVRDRAAARRGVAGRRTPAGAAPGPGVV